MNDVQLFALLIDGDNIQSAFVPHILNKLNSYGKTIFRRVYLSDPAKSWTPTINEYSLKAVWVTNNTKGKNAADITLVIDAMDLLYNNENLTGFCIASSDSDFTALARYIEEKGKTVLGIGESKTPISFQSACWQFIDIEDLQNSQAPVEQAKNLITPEKDKPADTDANQIFETLFIQAYENATKDTEGWARLNEIREGMKSLNSELSGDFQNGRKLAEKVKELAAFYPNGIIEVDEKLDSKPVIHYIRMDYDAFMFFYACKQIFSKERDGWILLSTIGDALVKYPAYENNGFSYRGRKQLLKIVTQMMKDYPNVIQIREEPDGETKIYLIRIK